MNKYTRTRRSAFLTRGIGGLLVALVCAVTLFGCKGSTNNNTYINPSPTAGSLNVNVNPVSAAVVVTGPASFTKSFTGNQLLTDLTPGQYTATATATGYADGTSQINVVAGQTSSISLDLMAAGSPAPTVGSLNINVNPASATVVVTGPASYTQTFTGNQFLTGLTSGQYTATATAAGFNNQTSSINVVASQTSSISLVLQATPIITAAPRTVYRDGNGNLIPITASNAQSGQFVFYAWLQDNPGGILATLLTSTLGGDPGLPLLSEQTEFAPSFTQNLAAAYVGFTDSTGVVRPVIGADVRWEIDQQYSGRVGSTQFGTSDDNRIAGDTYGVFDDQADTRTNNSQLDNERFPLIASQYPLYDVTGIGTPFVDGFTWVTLFSPDATAKARIIAVATINGEEIGKQILYKNFAPAPQIEITKTVDQSVVNLGSGGTGTVTFTVTAKNVGTGDATSVSLNDVLSAGTGTTYALNTIPAGGVAVGDGFTLSFPLASPGTPVPPQTAQLLGNAESFAVLANATVTNTGSSVVNGNVGVSAGSAVTGFPPGLVLNGTIHNNDAAALAAQAALTTAYDDLGARPCTDSTNKALTGTFTPGVYCYSSSAALSGPLVLDAQNNPAAEFVFKIGSTLNTPAGATVSLINGASPCNVYWQVGSSATIGSNTFFAGNILAQASITGNTGASISGRALARTGSVTMDTNAIKAPLSCVAAPSSSVPLTFTATVTAPGTYCNQAQILSYSDAAGTFSPVDLNAQACFTAVSPVLSIVKDFVADDNVTSLGKSVTVTKNVPAKLRVRVINNGTGGATGVTVGDVLASVSNGGIAANYTVVSVSSGATITTGGFNSTSFDLASGGASTTILFTVKASTDGQYCDTATITSGGTGSDNACLNVSTPNLTITKTNAPANVLPGGSYTSTIVVTSNGNAPAKNVVVSDLLGLNSAANIQAIYVSSNLNGAGGTLASNVVTANSVVNLAVGETLTFTVVSRIPLGAPGGQYCDIATVTSSNVVTMQSNTACVTVPFFAAEQTQLVDKVDPISIASGINETYFAVMSVEKLSNEGVSNNVITFSFGLPSPTTVGTPGDFRVVSSKFYLDSSPIVDPITGVIVSDPSNPTAVLLTEGANADYVVDNSTPGLQILTMHPNVILQPGTCIYAVQQVSVQGVPASHQYTTNYIWKATGLLSTITYQGSSSEPTTVLP